jgi:hypothetical protein
MNLHMAHAERHSFLMLHGEKFRNSVETRPERRNFWWGELCVFAANAILVMCFWRGTHVFLPTVLIPIFLNLGLWSLVWTSVHRAWTLFRTLALTGLLWIVVGYLYEPEMLCGTDPHISRGLVIGWGIFLLLGSLFVDFELGSFDLFRMTPFPPALWCCLTAIWVGQYVHQLVCGPLPLPNGPISDFCYRTIL